RHPVKVLISRLIPLEAEDDLPFILLLEQLKDFLKRGVSCGNSVDLDEQVVDLNLSRLLSWAPLNELSNHHSINPLRKDDTYPFKLLLKAHPHFVGLFRTKKTRVGIQTLR